MLHFFSATFFGFFQTASAEDSLGRNPLPSNPIAIPFLPDTPVADFRLTIKFQDGLLVRALEDGSLYSEAGQSLRPVQRLAQQHDLSFRQMVAMSDVDIAKIENRAQRHSNRAQPDLRGMMIVELPQDNPNFLLEMGVALQNLAEVEYAYVETIGTPPPGDIGTPTPDMSGLQSYVGVDPGVEMTHLHSLGYRGGTIRLSDCEYGWNQDHEDLMDIDLHLESGQTVPTWVIDYGYDEHGTAVIGESSAVDNGYGATGLVPDAEIYTYPEYSEEEGSRRVTAILRAISESDAGDVVLLEMQTQASYISGEYLYGPAELNPNVWIASRLGVDSGVVIVSAAGNGAQDLDDGAYAPYQSYGDSGAILVGAGSSTTDHSKLPFSTHGARVNVQGWGENVFSTGYGSYVELDNDKNQAYTSTFSGTSSASPIVASVCVALQDYVVANNNPPLSPAQLRQLLMDTGTAQGAGSSTGNIGPFPTVPAAVQALDADMDGWINPAYGGVDCDDTSAHTHPGSAELDSTSDCMADADNDGYGDVSSISGVASGTDCNDADATVNVNATETWYDGVDQNCDGANDFDQDGDGFASDAHGGTDCDDTDANINTDAVETWYDGVDSNCDGADDFDQDGDGFASDAHGGTDCDDTDATINTDATETWYDGIDSNCDGANDLDQDGDGFAADAYGGTDCDDTDANINTDAVETWYDGIDQDCDGADDFDQDGDGFAADAHGGTDCDDTDANINTDINDIWYDGVDSNCDEADDFDQDSDGFPSGEDCNDVAADVHPDATEIWYDGVDSNCDGANDFDQDGDGFSAAASGGADCDDNDASIHPDAAEISDGLDNDCDGYDETRDADGDGLSDLEEQTLGSNPNASDSDGDGISDGDEVTNGTDPLSAEKESGCSSAGSAGMTWWPLGLVVLAGLRRRPHGSQSEL